MPLMRKQALFDSGSNDNSGIGAGIGAGQGTGNQGIGIDDLFQNVLDVKHPGRSFRMENLKRNPLFRLLFPQKQKVYKESPKQGKKNGRTSDRIS